VDKQQITDILVRVGLKPGDGLLVHSALQFLGRPLGGVEMYFHALRDVLGPEYTFAVPTFNFGFARGEEYDPQKTPSQGMGVFSEYVRQLPQAFRTTHPLQSLAIIGTRAQDLAGRDTLSAFDDGSAFDGMLEQGYKLLLLGAEVQAVAMVHYSENRAGVPYRYWKDFTGRVRTPDGWKTLTYRMYVRDLEVNPELRLKPIQETLEVRGQWSAERLNYGWVSMCTLEDFVIATDDLLEVDPWALVGNREDVLQRYSTGRQG
jgi:aminoglycoside 3-N-acetyltransferase